MRVLAGGLYERTSGAAGRPLAGYRRRTPERTVLHELVARHAQTMFAELRDTDPDGRDAVRGAERLRAWHEGFSLHAGVVIADHDRDALERLCGTAPGRRSRRSGWRGPTTVASRTS